MKKEIVIYTDDLSEYIDAYGDDIKADLKANADDDHEPTADEISDEASARIEADADDLREMLNAYDKNNDFIKIIVVASFGLWYGRREARGEFKTLAEAVRRCFYDYNRLYFTAKNSTLNLCAIHHDGRNYYKFYAIDEHGKKHAIKEKDLLK